MRHYPVHLAIEPSERFTRLQLLIRLLAFVVLGTLGLSLGGLFVVAYVALPAFAAARLASRHDARGYLEWDGPRVVGALRWFAAVYAWFGLATDRLPVSSPTETVRLEVEPTGRPTPASALLRLLFGLPSAFVLALLGMIGWLVWLWGVLDVLVRERLGEGTSSFLVGMQRWAVRLLAYQASLVEEYPPFTFEETLPAAPRGAPDAGPVGHAGETLTAGPTRRI
jgi:hypothetical protein